MTSFPKNKPLRSEAHCSIDGCGSVIRSRGLCNRHYIRARIGQPKTGISKFGDGASFLEKARSLLDYDRENGNFTWRVDWYGCKAGEVAGTINVHGYVVISLFANDIYAHRLAWQFETGKEPFYTIDHRDCNRSNNAFVNLRDVPQAINSQNERRARAGNVSGLLGVTWRKDIEKWQAGITLRGKYTYLGIHETKEKAHEAYLLAKRTMHEGCTI